MGIAGGLLTLPVTTIKKTKIQVLFNPTTSETKALELYATVGIGSLEGQNKQPVIRILNEKIEEKIEEACAKYAPRTIEQCKSEMYEWENRKDSSIVQFCKEEEIHRNKMLKQQQVIYQQQQQQQLQEECVSERHLCKIGKKFCIEKLEKERLPREEAEHICEKELVFCTMKSQSRQMLKSTMNKIEKGTALSLSLGAILRGSQRSEDKKIETHIGLSHMNKPLEEQKIHLTVRTIVET